MFKSTPSDSRTGPEGPVLRAPSGRVFQAGLIAAVVGSGLFFDHKAASTASSRQAAVVMHADLVRELASANVRQVAQWAMPATPAGRFVTDTWKSAQTDAIVWVNGDVALSLHALPSPASPGLHSAQAPWRTHSRSPS